jgi:hypothetical protein
MAFPKLCGIELTFLGHPLVRLGGTFDLVLKVVALGRQKLRDLIDAARTATDAKPPRCTIYSLANLEFMVAHRVLHSNNILTLEVWHDKVARLVRWWPLLRFWGTVNLCRLPAAELQPQGQS